MNGASTTTTAAAARVRESDIGSAQALVQTQQAALALSWPLSEQGQHFDLGHVLNSAVSDSIEPPYVGALAIQHAGLWECNLVDDSLIWSGGTYDLFGLERGIAISRDDALAHFSEDSRAKLQRLRGHSIRNHCGFTLDVEIRAAAVGQLRRVRIIGAPIYQGELAVRVHGLKLIL